MYRRRHIKYVFTAMLLHLQYFYFALQLRNPLAFDRPCIVSVKRSINIDFYFMSRGVLRYSVCNFCQSQNGCAECYSIASIRHRVGVVFRGDIRLWHRTIRVYNALFYGSQWQTVAFARRTDADDSCNSRLFENNLRLGERAQSMTWHGLSQCDAIRWRQHTAIISQCGNRCSHSQGYLTSIDEEPFQNTYTCDIGRVSRCPCTSGTPRWWGQTMSPVVIPDSTLQFGSVPAERKTANRKSKWWR